MIAVLCSGQGGQHREMFRLTGGAVEAAPVFAAAEAVLGTDPLRFVAEADEAALFGNRVAQILCCTQALAAWSVIAAFLPERVVLAGYSVGELAAWGCAGWFGTEQTLRLAAVRAACMDAAATPADGMAGVIGPDRFALEELLDGRAFVAIINAADSHVIGGRGERFAEALDALRFSGAHLRSLPVAAASHTALLQAASERFATALAGETLGKPDRRVRLLRGIDGQTVRDGALEALASQLSRTLDWAACLDICRESASSFLELGPGDALARMAGDGARPVEAFRTVDGLRRWIARR